MAARLQEKYQKEVAPALAQEFGRTNPMSVPRLTKIVVSMGVGKALGDETKIETVLGELTQIAGQKPVVTRAKGAISNFKLRQGMKIGLMVTLRGQRMYEFLDRLVSLAVPRVRDFRGLDPSSFDGRGNYGMGLTEYGVFPEINPDKVTYQQGMNITICTTARNDAEARRLLVLLGMPFRS
jgi:large subunit ribosomal protein L5